MRQAKSRWRASTGRALGKSRQHGKPIVLSARSSECFAMIWFLNSRIAYPKNLCTRLIQQSVPCNNRGWTLVSY